jgi:hypothetical protein
MNIFFISYKESNAEINWMRCKELHPNSVRIHGIKGIDKIHLLCDELSTDEFFWTVDGDNYLLNPIQYTIDDSADLIMFHAFDPIMNQPTLLGGLKLWKQGTIINRDMSKGDFSLNATKTKSVKNDILSRTDFNHSPFDAWKTAFRHCVKLDSVIFRSRPNAKNIENYLNYWKEIGSMDNGANNARWCYKGYLDAIEYVSKYNNTDELYKINNYDWLSNYFNERYC